MGLKTVLENLEGVDDAVKSLYTEEDGKYVLDIDGVDDHPDVARLRNAYNKEKEKRQEQGLKLADAEAKLSKLPSDFDPQKWEDAKKGKADPEELVKLRETLEAERDEWKGKYETTVERARKTEVDSTLTSTLAENGVTNPSLLKGAKALLSSGVSLDEQGRAIVDTDMGPMPLQDHVKRWIATDEGKSYVTPAKGGGAGGGSGGGKPAKKWSEMSSGEKTELYRSDPTEYQRLKEAG